jgi:hypothetical protein
MVNVAIRMSYPDRPVIPILRSVLAVWIIWCVTPLAYPKDAFHSADDAADHSANDGSDRSSCLIPHGSPVRHASRNALGLRGKRYCQCTQQCTDH